jgi:hypothetical protein
MPSLQGEWELSSRFDWGRALGCQSLRTVLGEGEYVSAAPIRCSFGNGANRPVRRNPFPGGMRQHGREIDPAGSLVHCRGLDRGNLMPA